MDIELTTYGFFHNRGLLKFGLVIYQSCDCILNKMEEIQLPFDEVEGDLVYIQGKPKFTLSFDKKNKQALFKTRGKEFKYQILGFKDEILYMESTESGIERLTLFIPNEFPDASVTGELRSRGDNMYKIVSDLLVTKVKSQNEQRDWEYSDFIENLLSKLSKSTENHSKKTSWMYLYMYISSDIHLCKTNF